MADVPYFALVDSPGDRAGFRRKNPAAIPAAQLYHNRRSGALQPGFPASFGKNSANLSDRLEAEDGGDAVRTPYSFFVFLPEDLKKAVLFIIFKCSQIMNNEWR